MAYAPVNPDNLSSSNVLTFMRNEYLVKRALKTLRPNTVFRSVCKEDTIPAGEGKIVKWYRITDLGANTNSVAEGIVPTAIGLAPSKTPFAQVLQYADYMNFSDIELKASSENVMNIGADKLGFRAALTVDNVTRSAIDGESSAEITPLGTFLQGKDFSAQAAILEGRNIMGFEGTGKYKAYCHPYTAFDIVNDPSAGSMQDLHKYTDPSKTGALNHEWRGYVGSYGNVDIFKSTNVATTAGPPSTYRSYLFGDEGLGASALEGTAPTMVTDPAKQRFKIREVRESGISISNPTGQIAGVVSYNFTYVGGIPLMGTSALGGNYGFSFWDNESSIVA